MHLASARRCCGVEIDMSRIYIAERKCQRDGKPGEIDEKDNRRLHFKVYIHIYIGLITVLMRLSPSFKHNQQAELSGIPTLGTCHQPKVSRWRGCRRKHCTQANHEQYSI